MGGRISVVGLVLGLIMAVTSVRAEETVYTPGSLVEPMQAVAAQAALIGLPFVVVGGHSPAHARQIEAGAPADLFISADPLWMDYLRDRHLIVADSVRGLASTHLVLIAPAGQAFSYQGQQGESLAAALGDGRLAIGDPATLPIGRFSRMALERLGAWNGLEGHLAMAQHARAIPMMVERGEVPAGIAFASEVSDNPRLRVVMHFPSESVAPVVYPIAIVERSADNPKVRALREYLLSLPVQAVLRAHGFDPPPP